MEPPFLKASCSQTNHMVGWSKESFSIYQYGGWFKISGLYQDDYQEIVISMTFFTTLANAKLMALA